MGVDQKKRSSKKFRAMEYKSRRQKVSKDNPKRRSWHPKSVNLKTFCPKLTFKNRYITSKNGSIGWLFVTHLTF